MPDYEFVDKAIVHGVNWRRGFTCGVAVGFVSAVLVAYFLRVTG